MTISAQAGAAAQSGRNSAMSQSRRFHLQRDTDVTGVSGTGRVADGILWPDGTASIRWVGPRPSVVFWDGGLADAAHVHGHGGATRIVWDDPAPADGTGLRGEQVDAAYRERAHLIALLATHYPAAITAAIDDTASEGWALVVLNLPTGQASWHIHLDDQALFDHVDLAMPLDPRVRWDGHTTEQKYERISQHTAQRAALDTREEPTP